MLWCDEWGVRNAIYSKHRPITLFHVIYEHWLHCTDSAAENLLYSVATGGRPIDWYAEWSPNDEALTGYKASKFNPDASRLTNITNETISEETADYCPDFYSVFAWSAQSVCLFVCLK